MPEKEIKVVNVNSPYQVVLNCGADNGVTVGTAFQIYGIGSMIKDPDTKEDLERLELLRGEGKVTHVQAKICTVDSTMAEEATRSIKRTAGSPLLAALSGQSVETESIRKKKPFADVQIGDRARAIKETQF